MAKDASKLDILIDRRKKLLDSNIGSLERIQWLLEDTKRYGVHLWSCSGWFIAVQMLESLVSKVSVNLIMMLFWQEYQL